MTSDKRAMIIAYNKKKAKYKEAYDDLMIILAPLESVLALLPMSVRIIIKKYM